MSRAAGLSVLPCHTTATSSLASSGYWLKEQGIPILVQLNR